MKKFALAFSLAITPFGAFAADMAVKAPPVAAAVPFSWTGFYIGGNVGGVSERSSLNTALTIAPNGAFNPAFDPRDLAAINAAGSPVSTITGVTGGVQAGYNWQQGMFVFGVEADIDAFSIRTSTTVNAPYTFTAPAVRYTISTSSSTDWLFTGRGRLGFTPVANLLLYATGGVAVTNIGVSSSFADNFVPPDLGASNSKTTKAGWTVGGGGEWAINRNWSLKAEYLYMDFGTTSTTMIVSATGFTPVPVFTNDRMTAQLGRIGFNYRF